MPSHLTEAPPGGSPHLWMNQPLQQDLMQALQTQPIWLPPVTSSSSFFVSVQNPLQPPWPKTSVVLNSSWLVGSPTGLLAELAMSLHYCLRSKTLPGDCHGHPAVTPSYPDFLFPLPVGSQASHLNLASIPPLQALGLWSRSGHCNDFQTYLLVSGSCVSELSSRGSC